MTAPDPRLEEIEARLSKATPGPWGAYAGCIRQDRSWRDESEIVLDYDGDRPSIQNAVFIAAAPADVAYLLAELRKAQDKLARVSDVLDNWQAEVPFQDAEESQRWYSLGKRHAAERIRYELAGPSAAVADATGGGE